MNERAAGVSAALSRRIANALSNGIRPALQKNNLRLGNIVLQKKDGKDTPAMREVIMQMNRLSLNTVGIGDTFAPGIVTRGSRTYATDLAGVERMIARRIRGENRVTTAGRRFHTMGYAQYMLQVPIVYVRENTNATFRQDYLPVTDNQLGWDVQLNVRGAPEQAMSQLNRFYDEWVASGTADRLLVAPSDITGAKMIVDNTRRPRFDMQHAYVRDGRRTVDTILDRVVFGTPLFPEDMWNLAKLHESSRRRNNECGIDVIVASAFKRSGKSHKRQPMMTADEASQALIQVALEHDPNGALATHAQFEEVHQTDEIAGIDEDLRLRKCDGTAIEVFKAGMVAFLKTPRSVDEINKAIDKGNIWRNDFAVDVSFVVTTKAAFLWCTSKRARLLMCLRLWGFFVAGDRVSVTKPLPFATNAHQCVRSFGTPVHLYQHYYEKLKTRLVLMNGSRCTHDWTPSDWNTRSADKKVSVVLNVWGDHVSTYVSDIDNVPAIDQQSWPENLLVLQNQHKDANLYDGMKPFTWPQLMAAVQGKSKTKVFWTDEPLERLEKGLQNNDLAFEPRYVSIGTCNSIDVQCYKGKKQSHVRIKRVPKEHVALREFCERVQNKLQLKLFYKGESAAVVGHNFVQLMLVKRRELITKAEKTNCGGRRTASAPNAAMR